MNPQDAMPKDYAMYYDCCWMIHAEHGIGMVRVIGGDMYHDTLQGKDMVKVTPKSLMCWWPRAGAFNVGTEAVYIARRAIRNMRKSAAGNDHYFVVWGSPYGKEVMSILRDGSNPKPIAEAIKLLDCGRMTSVAITRDLIITTNEDTQINKSYTLLFRGLEAGMWRDGSYEAQFSSCPLQRRVRQQLEDASWI